MELYLYKKVEETVKRYHMLNPGELVLAGVSGGPDSVFLLEALFYLKDRLEIDIAVANVDHAIRGRESSRDSSFVAKKAKELGLRYLHKKLRLPQKELSGELSTEELLREKRYAFFKEAAKNVKACALATGHTLDDQAETVLMRVVKGATIKGLAGIPPVGSVDGMRVIRPLIELEKKEILAFLGANRIPYRIDKTNLKEDYFRNTVRNKILPYLEEYNPRIKRTLCLMAESLRDDREFIENEKQKRKRLKKSPGCVELNIKDIVVQPKSLRREILRDAVIETGANVKKLTFRHWRDMDDFLRFNRRGQSLDLPGGVIMKRSDCAITFERRA